MLIRNNLLDITLGFDTEGAASGGAPQATLLGGTNDGSDTGPADAGGDDPAGAGATGGVDGEGGDAPDDKGDAGQPEKSEGAGEGDEGDPAPGAPEAYDFSEFLTEEGVQFDEEVLGEFETILRENNIPQDNAVKFMGVAQKLQDTWLKQVTDAHVAARMEWREAAKNDPKIGGDKFAENLAIANEALTTFGDDELRALLNTTGLGDNPAFIRLMHNVGVVNREHSFVKSGKPEKSKPFYDHPTSQPKG